MENTPFEDKKSATSTREPSSRQSAAPEPTMNESATTESTKTRDAATTNDTSTPATPDIKGWGIDADPKNDPTYPMKHRNNREHRGYSWDRPPQQPLNTEVLHSNERPNITAVYGTAAPPTGLSGIIRRRAFRYGEGSYGHWLLLLMADRINAVEGVIDDVRRGRIPNVYAEKGVKAQWKHDKPAIVKKVAVTAAIGAGIAILICSRKRRRI